MYKKIYSKNLNCKMNKNFISLCPSLKQGKVELYLYIINYGIKLVIIDITNLFIK